MTPELISAYVERFPFAFPNHITEEMQERIAHRIQTTVYKEGHRGIMPASKQSAAGSPKPETATVVGCVLAMLATHKEMTFTQLRIETGLHKEKLQHAVNVLCKSGEIVRFENRGVRHTYALAQP